MNDSWAQDSLRFCFKWENGVIIYNVGPIVLLHFHLNFHCHVFADEFWLIQITLFEAVITIKVTVSTSDSLFLGPRLLLCNMHSRIVAGPTYCECDYIQRLYYIPTEKKFLCQKKSEVVCHVRKLLLARLAWTYSIISQDNNIIMENLCSTPICPQADILPLLILFYFFVFCCWIIIFAPSTMVLIMLRHFW